MESSYIQPLQGTCRTLLRTSKPVFQQIDLLTLFLCVRIQPMSNRLDNAYGYTEGYKSVFENISYTIAADDVNKYFYDMHKLFGLMVLPTYLARRIPPTRWIHYLPGRQEQRM